MLDPDEKVLDSPRTMEVSHMAAKGKAQLLLTFVATPDKVAEVERLIDSHAAWMEKTHHRDGPKELLSYNFAGGPELANPLDPGSESTGSTRYVLNEIYESPAGVEDHWSQAQESWADLGAFIDMVASSDPQMLHSGEIVASLW